jgi:5-formyltetrahydrofolate cyclo-ligase
VEGVSRQKRALRQAMIIVRDRLSDDCIRLRSAAIAQNLFGLADIGAARHFFVYVSYRSEVYTHAIIQSILDAGKQVSVPVVRRPGTELRAARVKDLRDLVPGELGILQPHPDCIQFTAAYELDAVLVPGLAFDTHGWRIGYGGGYYDRFLRDTPLPSWGLAFDLQVLDSVPHISGHDMPVDYIVTETRMVTCG